MRGVVWVLVGIGFWPVAVGGQQVTMRSLAGLTSVGVVVEYLDPVAMQAGVNADTLAQAAERVLRAGDVPRGAVGTDGSGTLFISVTMMDVPGGGGVFAYRYDLSLVGFVIVDGRRVTEPRWACNGLATTVAGSVGRVYDSVGKCTDKLAVAWRGEGRR